MTLAMIYSTQGENSKDMRLTFDIAETYLLVGYIEVVVGVGAVAEVAAPVVMSVGQQQLRMLHYSKPAVRIMYKYMSQ